MIGSVVGNYKIVDKLGEGGMGSVFKGVDLMLEREVAIKMLRPELASQANVVERFRSEAVTLAKLNHPNVATLHSFFRQGNDFFMVMEFVRGETLDTVIKRQGAMPCDRAVELFCHALEGIDHAHKMGIVHRDIKPANMMLTEGDSIKVMDFGIARVLGTDRMTRAGHLIGTVEYMSPEQVRGEETDARSDIYSLGILLYEMLTGRVPFNSTSEYELMRSQIEDAPTPPRTFAPHIPLGVEQAIMRSLAKMREARYQSAFEMRATLTSGMTGALADTPPRPTVWAAPATVVDRPVPATPSGEIKATRLDADDSGQMKETRLGQADGIAYAQPLPGYQAMSQPARQAAPSILSRLNWKHYTGAGAALVVLITLPLVLLGGGGKPAPKPGTVTQPTSPAYTESAPAQPAQAVEVPSQLGAPISSGSQPNNPNAGGDSSGGKSTRSRNSGGSGDASSSDGSSEGKAGSGGTSQGEKGSASKREQKSDSGRDVAKKEVKKESEKKDEKKTDSKDKGSKIGDAANAVGGAVNKIKGLFGKKKND
jgi:serine/threonine-protein kinase